MKHLFACLHSVRGSSIVKSLVDCVFGVVVVNVLLKPPSSISSASIYQASILLTLVY